MTTLANFPHHDQRTEATKDGRPPENGNYDCVATSFACAIQYYTGQFVSGDELKDAEYGESYRNAGTALSQYVDQASDLARAKYGVTAVPLNGDPWTLVRYIHQEVDAGRPVEATIPSQWGLTRAQTAGGSTHCIVFFKTYNGGLVAMNPWGGFDHDGSDQYWADRLCENQVWSIRKEAQGALPSMPLDINTVKSFFQQQPNGNWYAPATKCVIMGGILGFYRTLPHQLGGLYFLGLPISGEIYPMSGVAVQLFERGVLVYDPSNKLDNPPAAGDVYFGHINSDLVVGRLASAMKAQLDAANANLAAAHNQVDSLSKQLDAAKSVAAGAQAQIDAANKAASNSQALAAQAQSDLKNAQAQVDSLNQALKDKQGEVDAAKAQLAAFSTQQTKAVAALKTLADALKEVA